MTATFAAAALAAARLAALLGWTPNTFWAATPADLHHALGLGATVDDPADGDALVRLMEMYPDG